VKVLYYYVWPPPYCGHRVALTVSFVTGAKKRRRKLKVKKPKPILQDRATSPCLPSTLLPPLPLPPVTTMDSVVASSPPVYTMPRVFGPFPPLSSKPVSGSTPTPGNPEGAAFGPCSEQPLWLALPSSQPWLLKHCRMLFADKALCEMAMDEADKSGVP
jgi:hypothetical protein